MLKCPVICAVSYYREFSVIFNSYFAISVGFLFPQEFYFLREFYFLQDFFFCRITISRRIYPSSASAFRIRSTTGTPKGQRSSQLPQAMQSPAWAASAP